MPWPLPNRWQTGAFVLLLLNLYLFFKYRWTPSSESASHPPSTIPHGKPVFRQRLVAVGDLHGDIDNARKVLQMAGVVDQASNWAAGTDILVQTGDIVDRGTYAWDIYGLMQTLRSQASGSGGRVVSILGNHEVMNAIGDWRYVTEDDIKHTGGAEERMRDMSENGWLGREWLANYSTTALVALSPYPSAPLLSFTHGSLRPSYPNLLPYPEKINDLGRSLLSKALHPPMNPPFPPNPYSGLPKTATPEEMELYDGGGPYWWRGLAEVEDEKTVCKWAKELQSRMGVRRIIGGHTPDFEKIVHRCNASVIIIDTGISRAYGGVLSALEITYTLHAIKASHGDHRQDPFMAPQQVDKKRDAVRNVTSGERYWEREEVYAIYVKGRKLIAVEEREIEL